MSIISGGVAGYYSANASSLYGQKTTATSALEASTASLANTAASTTSGHSSTVTLSSAAQQSNALSNYYAQFFPSRTGMTSDALVRSVISPGSVSSSQGKTLADVATDARSRMDANYATMKASGTPYDANSPGNVDTISLMGNLDRRSLYSVSENVGGLFSEQEQKAASSLMKQQLSLAMGEFVGPAGSQAQFVDPYAGDETARNLAGAKFLAAVSSDEKSSAAWNQEKAPIETALRTAALKEQVSKPLPNLFDLLSASGKENGSTSGEGGFPSLQDIKATNSSLLARV
ncbi:hypothetical protein [Pseudomonas sp. UBA6310]|uniref:hypothetical protein n=1 Tax=Pseudomonas sp. UBA6310 TaxID=1947327 RepID=UPI00257E384A|nr:hypothetical protein [Pseudomonas sp. UBA6310]